MTPVRVPAPGDVWSWPDGKLAVLSASDIARGHVVVRFGGRDIVFPLSAGRHRDEPHILATAAAVFGVGDVS